MPIFVTKNSKIPLFVLLGFFQFITNAYSQEKEVELRQKLFNAPDSTLINTYYDQADYYYKTTGKGDSMVVFGERILKLSKKNRDVESEIGGLRLIGTGFMINRKFDKAEDFLLQSLSRAQSSNTINELAQVHNRLGGLYQNIDKIPKAIQHLLNAAKYSGQVLDFKTEAMAYYGISVIYSTQKQTNKQLEYISKATILCDKKNEITPLAKNVIYGSASQQYSILGSDFKYENYKDSSYVYAVKALEISKKYDLKQRIPSSLIVLSTYFQNEGDYNQAKLHAAEAMEYTAYMREDTKLNAFLTLSEIYRLQNQKKMCYIFLDSLNKIKIKKRPHYGSIIEKHKYIAYKHFKDFDYAFESLDNYFDFESKKKEIEQNKTINELEAKYKSKLKDAEIKRLTFLLILAGAIILCGLLLFSIFRLIKSKKQNLILKEAIRQQLKLEKELINVRNNIAQDFHDDLGNKLARISFLSRLVEDELTEGDSKVRSKVIQVKEDAVSLYLGTKDFIFSLKPNSDYLEEAITYLSDFGEDYFNETHIEFILDKNINLNKKLPHYWSKQLIFIFKEAMTNAFKHAKCDILNLKFEHINDILTIYCIDNGIGISEEDMKSKNGLLNMKKRAKKIKGKLEIISNIDKGTTVKFKGKTEKNDI